MLINQDDLPPSTKIILIITSVIGLIILAVVIWNNYHPQKAEIKTPKVYSQDYYLVEKIKAPKSPIMHEFTLGDSNNTIKEKESQNARVAVIEREYRDYQQEISQIEKNIKEIEIEEKIIKVFGEEGQNAIRIAKCESSLKENAINFSYGCYGIFQIMAMEGRPSPEQLLNIDININTAYQIYKDSGWGAWECK
ncbi:MAG: hypothetical protein BWY74_00332 [Firmicutes bacterium ADurb.Bin419]|nr:MAG: hypothetical protein BWY74_00332 [Firmicutes bacterium ADurb.Bin419]